MARDLYIVIKVAEEQSKGSLTCELDDRLCNTTEFTSRLMHGRLNLYTNAKYDEYKEILCSVSAQGRDCLRVTPSTNCSANSAETYTDMIKIANSLSICDNTDIKKLFVKYGGGLKCRRPKLDSHCFQSSLMSRISHCETLILESILDKKLPARIDSYCSAQECNIKCYEDAMRDCDVEDEHLEMDTISMRVATRVTCENLEDLKAAVAVCNSRERTCYTNLKHTLVEAHNLKKIMNNTAYSYTVCNATSKSLNCLDYVSAGNCTTKLATLLKDIVTVLFSYARCGPQNHIFFSKYDNKTSCVTSGSQKSVFTILPLIFISLFLFFSNIC